MERTPNLLEQLDDPDRYEIGPRTPVFDEHEETDFGGNLARFDRARLEALAAHNNARAVASGDLPPITLGHTVPGLPETAQPPIVGYARDFDVEPFGPSGKLALTCTPCLKKDQGGLKLLDTYPRRSIELWKDGTIDPIALLKRTPRRDLGLTTFRRQGEVIRYERDDIMGDEKALRDWLTSALASMFPHLKEMHGKYAADCVSPGAGNTDIPGDSTGNKDDDPTKPLLGTETSALDEPERMARDSAAVQYSRVQQELAALRQEVQAAQYARGLAESERVVAQLEFEGYVLDRAAETKRMASLDAAARQEREGEIRRFYQRSPVSGGAGFLRLGEPSQAAGTSISQRNQAVALATREGITYDAALVRVRGS